MSSPLERLPHHLRTRRTAEALTAPSAILLAGAGASVGILAGLPIAAAAGIGALAWVARVLTRLPRGARGERIDPFTLRDPWRRYVKEALDAQQRFGRALHTTAEGPLRDRLAQIGRRLDAGVKECWRIARRGDTLDAALADNAVASAQRQLAAERRRLPPENSADYETAASTVRALEAQVASWERLARVAHDASNRLRVLDARLDEAVARAVELSLRTGEVSELSGLDSDVDALVDELESLRLGLEEAGQVAGQPRAQQT